VRWCVRIEIQCAHIDTTCITAATGTVTPTINPVEILVFLLQVRVATFQVYPLLQEQFVVDAVTLECYITKQLTWHTDKE
jgi:hypothetical protein